MIINENNFDGDLRELFAKTVVDVFGKSVKFFEILENEDYSSKFDCFFGW